MSSYAGIDIDPELKYPKGAGRVSFATQASYMAAIGARFVHIKMIDIDKRVPFFAPFTSPPLTTD